MRRSRETLFRSIDVVLAPAMLILAPLASGVARLRHRAPLSRSILDKFQVAFVRHHYYEPIVFPADLKHDLRLPRQIPGLDLNERGQFELLQQFRYRDELLAIPLEQTTQTQFAHHNPSFGPGDAEMLYNMIRHLKPRRIVEI